MAISGKRWNALLILTLLLSVISLFVEQMEWTGWGSLLFTNLIDFIIVAILIAEIIAGFTRAPFKTIYLRRNALSLLFFLVFVGLFVFNKYISYTRLFRGGMEIGFRVLVVRNFFLVLKVFSRYRRISTILENLHIHPAQTILLSFLTVILAGTWLLMMPFSARVGQGLPFLDALFTATSAVCVTGLVVVDTATYFSVWGQVVVMLLIQIGGLGIMVLSYFTLVVTGRKVSVDEKKLISYMLSEEDMNRLSRVLKSIISITFIVEAVGAALLFIGFRSFSKDWTMRLFLSVFHAVSAFCNAGFALFSDSLESFGNRPIILVSVAALIIAGGLSFAVMTNLVDVVASFFRRIFSRRRIAPATISLNTRIVLVLSFWLVLSGIVVIYALEHGNTLRGLPVGNQYLAAFFQSVTLRTAGFNSIPFGGLSTAMLLVMVVYMFIGGASGSTAGGIKINTLAVLGGTVRSSWRNDDHVTIRGNTVSAETVNRAFLIFLVAVAACASGTLILSLSEDASLREVIFEAVSAFATVGLSTGITGNLSGVGKVVVILLMFVGRLGPLTVLAASSTDRTKVRIAYPQANIAVG